MQISLNGKTITTGKTTLADLIQETGFDTRALIAEHNLHVISQKDWDSTALKEGDQVELLSFVGGG